MRDYRTGPASGAPLDVEPAPPFVRLFASGQAIADVAPLALSLSDGGRWRRDPFPPRRDYAFGVGLGPVSGALLFGTGTVGLSAQVDAVRGAGWKLATAAAARLGFGGGFDLSLVPFVSAGRPLGRRVELVRFAALRARWGQTLYDVQGWSADRASPYATALTRDLALAPMAGVALAWRFAELRLTAGWELLLVNHVDWEERPVDLHREGGPFASLALRLRLGSD